MPLVPAAVSAICIGPPQSNRPDTTSSIEEDLLGLEDLSLVLISCKRGGDRARLLRAVEELDSAGRTLGGHHTRRHLAVATPLPKYLADELKARCASTHTQLIGPASKNLTQLFA